MAYRDRKLLRELTAGQKCAYVQAVERHYRRLYAFLYRLTQNETLAEDLAQEAFAAAWRALDQFNSRSSFSTWLYKIALNVYRQHRRHERLPVETLDEEIVESWPDPGPGPLERVLAEELQLKVQQALAKLPEIYREVIILRVYQELKYREVAEVLGIPLGTVQYRLHIAFRKLREALREEIEDHESAVQPCISEP